MKVDSLTPHISDHINLDETVWLIIGDLDIIQKSLREKFSYPIVILDIHRSLFINKGFLANRNIKPH